jgi:hypothetical protein
VTRGDTIQGIKERIGGEAYVEAIFADCRGCRLLGRENREEENSLGGHEKKLKVLASVGPRYGGTQCFDGSLGLEPALCQNPRLLPPLTAKLRRAFFTAPIKIPPSQLLAGPFATTTTANPKDHRITVKMAPKQKTVRPAQENISLGPQVREGELVFGGG